jgi:exosortase A-associated hydrolase 2
MNTAFGTPHLLAQANGFRYLVHYAPPRAHAALLWVPPFAEEMHALRPAVHTLARAAHAQGWATLLWDLRGCGDSSGTLAEVRWTDWLADLQAAHAYLRAAHPERPIVLLGTRLGALLALDALRHAPDGHWAGLLCWQGSVHGAREMQQFRRLRTAALWLESAATVPPTTSPDPEEIAGYPLSTALRGDIEARDARDWQLAPTLEQHWIDCIDQPEARLPQARADWFARWNARHPASTCTAISGPAFWLDLLAPVPEALIAHSLATLARWSPHVA